MELTNKLGGEKYVTSTIVTPAILSAERAMRKQRDDAARDHNSLVYITLSFCVHDLIVRASVNWFDDIFKPLYDYYLHADYALDDTFMVAALLNPNGGGSVLHGINNDTFNNAKIATIARLQQRVDALALDRRASAVAETSLVVADPSMPMDIALAGMQWAEQQAASSRAVNVQFELNTLLARTWAVPNVRVDPVEFYLRDEIQKEFPTASHVALSVFVVPAGEAQCERVFSISGFFNNSRRRFAPQTLSKLTFCRINNKNLF